MNQGMNAISVLTASNAGVEGGILVETSDISSAFLAFSSPKHKSARKCAPTVGAEEFNNSALTPLSVQRRTDRMESSRRGIWANPYPEMLDTFAIINPNDANGSRITTLVKGVFLIVHHIQRLIDRLRER